MYVAEVGLNLPTPFFKISIVVANEELISVDSIKEAVYDKLYCSISDTLIASELLVTTSIEPIDGTSTYRWVSDNGNSSTILIIPLASTLFPFT